MCSSPKGSRARPMLSSHVDSTFEDMSSAEYSDMVRRANESYEYRQEELAELRRNKKQVNTVILEDEVKLSLLTKAKAFMQKHFFSLRNDEELNKYNPH